MPPPNFSNLVHVDQFPRHGPMQVARRHRAPLRVGDAIPAALLAMAETVVSPHCLDTRARPKYPWNSNGQVSGSVRAWSWPQ